MRYKQWVVYVLLKPAMATTPRLLPELVRRFRAMTPFVEFLNAPVVRRRAERKLEELFV